MWERERESGKSTHPRTHARTHARVGRSEQSEEPQIPSESTDLILYHKQEKKCKLGKLNV
jgi:hypothetical protein